jgi:hypothetical protein
MNTWKGLASRRPTIILSTNLSPGRPDGFPPTGKTSWWSRDHAMGGDPFGGLHTMQMRTVELGLRGHGDVTVEVRAVAMNPIDDAQRRRRPRLGSARLLLAGPVALTFPSDERPNAVAALIGRRPGLKLAVAV